MHILDALFAKKLIFVIVGQAQIRNFTGNLQ